MGVDVRAGETASFSEVRGSKGMDGFRDGDIFSQRISHHCTRISMVPSNWRTKC